LSKEKKKKGCEAKGKSQETRARPQRKAGGSGGLRADKPRGKRKKKKNKKALRGEGGKGRRQKSNRGEKKREEKKRRREGAQNA